MLGRKELLVKHAKAKLGLPELAGHAPHVEAALAILPETETDSGRDYSAPWLLTQVLTPLLTPLLTPAQRRITQQLRRSADSG